MVTDWATLSTQLYHGHTSHPPAHRRHLFATSVDSVFQVVRARIIEKHFVLAKSVEDDRLIDLLACMVRVLRWSLIHQKYNCGSYTPIQWIKSIAGCYEAAKDSNEDPWTTVPLTGKRAMWPIFRLVLALLKACVDQNLLLGVDSDDFNTLVTLLGQPVELPKLRRELCDPPAGVERTEAGPEDGVSTVTMYVYTVSYLLTRHFAQPLEPFEFEWHEHPMLMQTNLMAVKALTRSLEKLVCESPHYAQESEAEYLVRRFFGWRAQRLTDAHTRQKLDTSVESGGFFIDFIAAPWLTAEVSHEHSYSSVSMPPATTTFAPSAFPALQPGSFKICSEDSSSCPHAGTISAPAAVLAEYSPAMNPPRTSASISNDEIALVQLTSKGHELTRFIRETDSLVRTSIHGLASGRWWLTLRP